MYKARQQRQIPPGAALFAVEQTHSEAEQQCKTKLKILKLGDNTVPNCRINFTQQSNFVENIWLYIVYFLLVSRYNLPKQKYWLLVTLLTVTSRIVTRYFESKSKKPSFGSYFPNKSNGNE
jgi:hypothetical protein